MPRHIVRLILLLVAAGVVALLSIRFFTVESFYRYGHYRGDSVAEIAADKPNFKGVAFCQSCHAERVAEWSKGAHNRPEAGKVVTCEGCHGAAASRRPHGVVAASMAGAEHPKDLKMEVPADTRQLCTLCHERTAGRPAEQPQIVVADHAGAQQCSVCHNPHSPKLASAAAATSAGNAGAGKAKAAACAGCHGAEGIGKDLPGPTLAGQNEAYFIEAMKAYANGARKDAMMSPAARGLSNQDLADLAAYYAAQKCQSSLAGSRQASAAAAKCVACHGADGVSANRAWPHLVGFSKAHLVDALQAYKSGARKDPMMAGVLKTMSDAEIDGAAAYYAAATCR